MGNSNRDNGGQGPQRPNHGQMAMLALGAQAFNLPDDRVLEINKLVFKAIEESAAKVNGKTKNMMDALNTLALEAVILCETKCRTKFETMYVMVLVGLIIEHQFISQMPDRLDPID